MPTGSGMSDFKGPSTTLSGSATHLAKQYMGAEKTFSLLGEKWATMLEDSEGDSCPKGSENQKRFLYREGILHS